VSSAFVKQAAFVHCYGSLRIVCYVMLDTGKKRVAIYDADLESLADLVADEDG
jgi:hypothetical protein